MTTDSFEPTIDPDPTLVAEAIRARLARVQAMLKRKGWYNPTKLDGPDSALVPLPFVVLQILERRVVNLKADLAVAEEVASDLDPNPTSGGHQYGDQPL